MMLNLLQYRMKGLGKSKEKIRRKTVGKSKEKIIRRTVIDNTERKRNKQHIMQEFAQVIQNDRNKCTKLFEGDPEKITTIQFGFYDLKKCVDFTYFSKLYMLKLQGNQLIKLDGLKLPSTIADISLGSNMIQSIEILTRTNLINIKVLKLYSNKLTSIRCLMKHKLSKLVLLDLQDNEYIKDIESLSQFWGVPKTNKTSINLATQFDKYRKQKIEIVQGKTMKLNYSIVSVIAELR